MADQSNVNPPPSADFPADPPKLPRRYTGPTLDFPENRGVELILPCQFVEREGRFKGERRLLVAVLQDALDAIIRPPSLLSRPRSQAWRDPRREAWEWINSDRAVIAFDFLSLCEHLGLNPDYLRSKLRRKYPCIYSEVPLTTNHARRTFNS